MGKSSRDKGKRAEREAAKAVEAVFGVAMRRAVQYCGKAGDADVVGLPGVHIEVKARAAHSCLRYLDQAASDARAGDVPIVLLREDGDVRFHALLALDDLPDLLDLMRRARSPHADPDPPAAA